MIEIDHGLDTLLDLNGETFPMDNGYWTKFEAHKVNETKHIPHGIKYSLTLHNPSNIRIFGIDNAHAIKLKKKKYGAKITTWDHMHKQTKVINYEFSDAGQLMSDFWYGALKTIDEVTS